jgi:hypothetical protein
VLIDSIERIQRDLRAGRFANEAAVSQGVLLPLLHELGWPVFDTRVVAPEYALEGTAGRLRAMRPLRTSLAFVEVKRVGQSEGGGRQLFEYAFIRGVPLALLTDGQEWSFYLPAEQGHLDERRVYKLDLLERSPAESGERLGRYLAHERVLDGTALAAARADHRDVARKRQIDLTLPRAWSALLDEQDSVLLELLAEKVEDICGYRPDPDACSRFLSSSASGSGRLGAPGSRTVLPDRPPPASPPSDPPASRRLQGTTPGFTLGGQRHAAHSAREVLQCVLVAFAKHDPTFLERFVARKHGRTRRYVSRDREELYLNRPDLAADHAVEFVPGWWLGTNYSKRSIAEIIELACEVAGVPASQLQISLG